MKTKITVLLTLLIIISNCTTENKSIVLKKLSKEPEVEVEVSEPSIKKLYTEVTDFKTFTDKTSMSVDTLEIFSRDKYEFVEFIEFSYDEKYFLYRSKGWKGYDLVDIYKICSLADGQVVNQFDSLDIAKYSLNHDSSSTLENSSIEEQNAFLKRNLDIKVIKWGFPKTDEDLTLSSVKRPENEDDDITSEDHGRVYANRGFKIVLTNDNYENKLTIYSMSGDHFYKVRRPQINFSPNFRYLALTPAISFSPYSKYKTGFIIIDYRKKYSQFLLEEGNIYFKRNDFSKAINTYKKGLYLNPENIDFYYYTGKAFFMLDDKDNALKYFSYGKTINPKLDELLNKDEDLKAFLNNITVN